MWPTRMDCRAEGSRWARLRARPGKPPTEHSPSSHAPTDQGVHPEELRLLLWSELCPSQIHMLKSWPLVPQRRLYLETSGGSGSKEHACSAGDLGLIPGLGKSPGRGNSKPLQYSCLENPMDRGACGATVHQVTKSWTRLRLSLFSKDVIKLTICVSSITQSCPILWDPLDCSPPGSPVHGSLQARLLEWVAIPFPRASS